MVSDVPGHAAQLRRHQLSLLDVVCGSRAERADRDHARRGRHLDAGAVGYELGSDLGHVPISDVMSCKRTGWNDRRHVRWRIVMAAAPGTVARRSVRNLVGTWNPYVRCSGRRFAPL